MRHKEIWGTVTLSFKTVFNSLLGEKEEESYEKRASKMCLGLKCSQKQLRVNNPTRLRDIYLATLKTFHCFICFILVIYDCAFGITVGPRRQESIILLHCFCTNTGG